MAAPAQRLSLFTTQVFRAEVPDGPRRNQELAACLLADEVSTPSLRHSNQGGWHSPPNITSRPEACFLDITGMVVTATRHLVSEMARSVSRPAPEHRIGAHGWAMIMRDGDYTMLHDHGEAHFSAVYYVDPGDEVPAYPHSGHLVLIDPRRSGRELPDPQLSPHDFIIEPAAGTLVIFPGWLQHYVHPYRGTRPRICLSWNLVIG